MVVSTSIFLMPMMELPLPPQGKKQEKERGQYSDIEDQE